MRQGGIAVWCIHHPVSTVMLTLTAIVLGLFSLSRLSIDLLPQLIYPQIGVRILDPAVPANIMEDQVTRQIEEQLAITEDSTGVESTTLEGTAEIVTPSGVAGLNFRVEANTTNKLVKKLKRKKGVKAFVVLMHEGGAENGQWIAGSLCNDVAPDNFQSRDDSIVYRDLCGVECGEP